MRHYKFIEVEKSDDLIVSRENGGLHKAEEFGYNLMFGLTPNNYTLLTLTTDDIKHLRKILRTKNLKSL